MLLRVEPVFADDELVARGVHMEALSLDDDGASVSFNVFCYNVQPGVGIDYATGDSWREQDAGASTEPAGTAAQSTTSRRAPTCSTPIRASSTCRVQIR